MKIKKGFELRDVCGEFVVLASGRENIDFSKVINLNESAAVIWKAVENREFSVEDMAQALLAEYEVDNSKAIADATSVASEWQKIGMITNFNSEINLKKKV